jgi:hypothetical protein
VASERVRAAVIRGERRVIGGMAVEITRHGKGFRVYGVVLRRGPKGDTVQLKRLPGEAERQILASYGSPYAGA